MPTISQTEGILLFRLTLCGLLIRIVEFVMSIWLASPKDGSSFGIYSIFDMEDKMSPLYSFMVFLLGSILAWKMSRTTSLVSIFLLALLAVFFDRWFFSTQVALSRLAEANNYSYPYKTFDFVLIDGSLFDVITLMLVNILLFWQLSIYFRLFASDRRDENLSA